MRSWLASNNSRLPGVKFPSYPRSESDACRGGPGRETMIQARRSLRTRSAHRVPDAIAGRASPFQPARPARLWHSAAQADVFIADQFKQAVGIKIRARQNQF